MGAFVIRNMSMFSFARRVPSSVWCVCEYVCACVYVCCCWLLQFCYRLESTVVLCCFLAVYALLDAQSYHKFVVYNLTAGAGFLSPRRFLDAADMPQSRNWRVALGLCDTQSVRNSCVQRANPSFI